MSFRRIVMSWNIKGKRVLVTGSTDGIGKETAKELLVKGAKVIVHGRDKSRVKDTVNELKNIGEADGVLADFASLDDVKLMADNVKKRFNDLAVLINNAGTFEPKKMLSKDGYELTFAVNHLAPFALTLFLLPLLVKNQPARIINVSSMAHSSSLDFSNLLGEKGYDGYSAYSYSKLANILFTFELDERLKKHGFNISVNCLHPGVIATKLLQRGWGFGGGSLKSGAETSVYLAVSEEVENISGKYFSNRRIVEPSSVAYNKEVREKLWRLSEELTGVYFDDIINKI